MKRTTLTAALTGAAVLLAGCSSTSGTAAPASSSSAAVTSSSSTSSSSMSSSAAPAGSAAAGVTATSSTSGEAPTSSADSSSDTASSTASVSSSSSTSKAPTTTIGNTSGGLDVQSAAWLSAFCTGFTPIVGQTKAAVTSFKTNDPTKVKAGLVTLYGKFGSIFSDTAAKLKPLDPPTFSGGSTFATKLITALDKASPIFAADAKRVGAIDAKTDPSGILKEAKALPKALEEAAAPLDELDTLKLTKQTEDAFEKLPACAKLNSSD